MAGGSLWESERADVGKWLSVGEMGFHESDLPSFFSFYTFFKADLLLIKVLAGQISLMLCTCFFFS